MIGNGKKQLPSGWKETHLGDLVTILRGVSYKKQDATTEPAAGRIPILRATNIDHRLTFIDLVYVPEECVSKFQLLNVGDIVIAASSGSRHVVGKAAALTLPWVGSFGAFCYGLRPHLDRTASYISLFLQTATYRDHVSALSAGVNINNLRREHIEGVPLPVAPLTEQNRIVAKIEELFSELDKGVESLKTAQAQLKVYRQAVLKHAFEGKLTEQWREENKDKLETPEQLLARIKQEREARYEAQVKEWKVAVKGWEENGKLGGKPTRPKKLNELAALTSGDLPALPKGWVWFKFGDLCSLIRNGISKKPKGRSGKMIFRISAVRAMEFNLDDVRFIADESGEFENYYLQRGDLVFTRYNGSRTYVGVCAEYKSDGSHLYPDKLIRTQLGTSQTLPGYIEKAVNCGASRHFIETRIRTTAGQYGISGSDIKEMPVPLCNLAEQVEIQDRVDEKLSGVSRLLADIEQNLDRAKSLGQSILKKTFSGQLVAQDPSDEPASVLLDRIKAEKEQTCKSGKSPKKTRKKRKTAA